MKINRKYFILPFILFFSLSTFSQEEPVSVVRFGLCATPNIGWIKPDTKDYSAEGSRFGFSYGIMGEFQIINNYLLSTGFNIKTTGGILKYPYQTGINNIPTDGILERQYSLKYIEIPFAIKMKTRQIGYFSYFGKFGLSTSFNIKAKADDNFTSADLTIVVSDNEDIEPDISFLRESLLIGAGLEYSLGGTTSLVFGLIYNNGFTDILTSKNKIDNSINENATSSYIEFNFGVLF